MEDSYNYRLAGRMWKLYVNNFSRYLVCYCGETWMPKDKDEKPIRLSISKLHGHLNGRYNIAVYASEKSARFICFDVDTMDKDLVLRLIDTLVGFGFERSEIHPSISGGKGYHVEIFIDLPEANATLYKLYRAVIEIGGFDRRKVEFRPTSKQAIRLPLSRHYKTGNMAWYCNVDTLDPIETTNYIFEIRPMERARFEEIVRGIKLEKHAVRNAPYEVEGPSAIFNYGKHPAPVITQPGTRHELMVKYARWLRGCGCSGAEIYKILIDWVADQDRGLITSTDEEIEKDAALIAEWAGRLVIEKESGDRIVDFGKGVFRFEDLNYILNGRNKNERRILFRSVLSQKVFGKDQASQRLIGESLGIAEMTAKHRIEDLVERGVIQRFGGKRGIKSGGRFFSTSNSYLPGENVADILQKEDYVGDWMLSEQLRWKNVLWYYANMMTCTLGDNLGKYVDRRELVEIGDILLCGRPVDGEAWYDK